MAIESNTSKGTGNARVGSRLSVKPRGIYSSSACVTSVAEHGEADFDLSVGEPSCGLD